MDVEAVFAKARKAQDAWRNTGLARRLEFLSPLRALLARDPGELVSAVEGANPRGPGDTVAAEILPLAEACRFLRGNAERILGTRRIPSRWFPLWLSRVSVEIRREPFGLILILGPSNYPLFLPGVQALQALVAGNVVAVKPGTGGRPAMEVLSDRLQRAGLDPDLFHVLDESVEAAKAALENNPDKVVLTGSLETGKAVLGDLAPRVIPAVMELSGCDAMFVQESADLHRVARAVAYAMRLNAGATCMATHRIFVPGKLAEALADRLVREVEALGSLAVERGLAKRALALLRDAQEKGARLLTGEILPGEVFRPVILADATPDMDLLATDVFSPMVAMIPVEDMEEALKRDAECPYALAASVFGREGEAVDLARRVKAGSVLVNDVIAPTAHPALPFGGRDSSGFGTTRGAEGLLEMTAVKSIATRRGRWLPHLEPPEEGAETVLRHLLAASHGGGWWTRFANLIRAFRAARSPRSRISREGDEA